MLMLWQLRGVTEGKWMSRGEWTGNFSSFALAISMQETGSPNISPQTTSKKTWQTPHRHQQNVFIPWQNEHRPSLGSIQNWWKTSHAGLASHIMHERPQWCNCPIRIQETRLPILGTAGVSKFWFCMPILCAWGSTFFTCTEWNVNVHLLELMAISNEMVRNSWDILNAILGHIHHQNHSNRVIYSEWSQHLQQKWLWLQSVNGWVLSTQSTVLLTSALGKHAGLLRN